MNRSRRGYALLVVIWVVGGLSIGISAIAMLAREEVTASHNRIRGRKAAWVAEACLAHALDAVDSLIGTRTPPSTREMNWLDLDSRLSSSVGCRLRVSAAVDGLDVNSSDSLELFRILVASGASEIAASETVNDILDWRDPDGDSRRGGDEDGWYLDTGNALPRNAALLHVNETRLIRGFRELPTGVQDSAISALEIEPALLSLRHASLIALRGLPGIEEGAARVLQELREDRDPASSSEISLRTLMGQLSGAARDSLAAHFLSVESRLSRGPVEWRVSVDIARSDIDAEGTVLHAEFRVRRTAGDFVVRGRRSWPA